MIKPSRIDITVSGEVQLKQIKSEFERGSIIDLYGIKFVAEQISYGEIQSERMVRLEGSEVTMLENTWTGEGLPPVGTVCELRVSAGDWSKAHIKFASRNVVVWDWDGEPTVNGLCTSYAHAVEMRPIRTPEQIAAEEREKAVQQMAEDVGHLNSRDTAIKVLYAIYDAGYRKQEQTK